MDDTRASLLVTRWNKQTLLAQIYKNINFQSYESIQVSENCLYLSKFKCKISHIYWMLRSLYTAKAKMITTSKVSTIHFNDMQRVYSE